MNHLDAIYANILANPDENHLRLIYADAIEESGDTDRANFIRLDIAVHTENEFPLWQGNCNNVVKLTDNYWKWLALYNKYHDNLMGLGGYYNHTGLFKSDSDMGFEFVRGLIGGWVTHEWLWKSYGFQLMQHYPIQYVRFHNIWPNKVGTGERCYFSRGLLKTHRTTHRTNRVDRQIWDCMKGYYLAEPTIKRFETWLDALKSLSDAAIELVTVHAK